jgi:radical SAM superfamily enzyme YgiQ (UPF0313 family)
MPPQGLLVIAAYLPAEWQVRFIDENKAPATERDYRWADAVFISGMHVQRSHILAINERAHAQGKLTVLGGPSVSASPEWYPQVDILHCGELGDATDRLLQRLDKHIARPAAQETYRTIDRLPLDEFPMPAYDKIEIAEYFLASVQFSSGCPFTCEFCDIPELYGRKPRLKKPSQVTAELDAILAGGNPGAVYFVDDTFIANPKAALVCGQQRADREGCFHSAPRLLAYRYPKRLPPPLLAHGLAQSQTAQNQGISPCGYRESSHDPVRAQLPER